MRLYGKRHAHQIGIHGVYTCGFGIEAKTIALLKRVNQAVYVFAGLGDMVGVRNVVNRLKREFGFGLCRGRRRSG